MKFDLEQYEIEGIGNLSVIRMNMGVMQMLTFVITSRDRNLPLLSSDYMYMLANRTVYVEFYDMVVEKWFGGVWGYILLVAIIAIVVYCINIFDISFNKAPISDGKLAYRACIAMEALIDLKNGTYSECGLNFVSVGEGKHSALYNEFVSLYPELASKDLRRLANTTIDRSDMFGK